MRSDGRGDYVLANLNELVINCSERGWLLGVEPRSLEPQSSVLPLNYSHHDIFILLFLFLLNSIKINPMDAHFDSFVRINIWQSKHIAYHLRALFAFFQ